jgi:CubicO group peptidase (beta-lactamase class C family)
MLADAGRSRMQRRFQVAMSIPALALGLVTDLWGQNAAPVTVETAQRIDAVFAPWNNTQSPGCVLSVSRNGNVVYARAYGMSNLEYDVALTQDSIFQVGSIAKQFTAFAIVLLASDGKLSLDDDIHRYLPELPDYGETVTIRQLLAHTAGFPDFGFLLRRAGWRFADITTEDDVLDILARHRSLNFRPGTEFLYSNTAYTLLAIIVRRVSGQSHREFAETRIFAPLGMRDTHIQEDHRMIVRRRTSAYEPGPEGGLRINIPNWDLSGATNLFTTAGDLLKWERNLVDGRVGGKALVDGMQVPGHLNDGSATDYGFGLLIEPYRGVRTINHSGGDAGYRAEVVRFPDHDLAIVTLCNLGTINPRILNRKVAQIVLGPRVFESLAPTLSITRAGMEKLVGTYWNASTEEVWRILIVDGRLMTGASPDALVALGDGRFRLGEQTAELKFSVSKTAVTLEVGGVPPMLKPATFTRVTAPTYSDIDLQAYAGKYRNDDLAANFTITMTPAQHLSLSRSKFEPQTLDPVTLDVFTNRVLGTVKFVRAPSGEVIGLANSDGQTRGVSFTRVDRAPDSRAGGRFSPRIP